MQKHKKSFIERRRFIRLSSVFPVEFCILSCQGEECLSEWLQGFTRDISRGGIGLSVFRLPAHIAALILPGQSRLLTRIHVPFFGRPIEATSRIVWISPPKTGTGGPYFIGVSFERIDPADNSRLFRYARFKLVLPRLSLFILCILLLGLAGSFLYNLKLRQETQVLLNDLIKITQTSRDYQLQLEQVSQSKELLEERLQERALERKKLIRELRLAKAAGKEVGELAGSIKRLEQTNQRLKSELAQLVSRQGFLTQELGQLDEKREVFAEATSRKMYMWIRSHQNYRSGLLTSFEGDTELKNWAFTYDQALAVQVFLLSGEKEAAARILDFYLGRAVRSDGAFLNAYYASTGDPAEYIVHAGPNIWLGIAVLQYTRMTADTRYLPLAQDIARWIQRLSSQDAEGGLRGGPTVTWYSTEHNLDAYAFFDLLYRLTKDEQYLAMREKLFAWLEKYAYGNILPPITRGKGDATIATDTYAWSIAAIGPQRLKESGKDPDKIMDFALQACGVTTTFQRPEGRTVEVSGFDFAKTRHLPRGGIISCEWTAQMIIAYRIMALYHQGEKEKALEYKDRIRFYLQELDKLIISSPSPVGQGEGCLPYASVDFADTGHGWMTPKGICTGSLAATSYAIFAQKGYNPLGEGREGVISLKKGEGGK